MIGSSAGISEKRVIQASEVESIIRAGGSAEFDDRTILGDLDLSELKIERPVHFNHTIFQDSVNFEYTTFNGTAYFWSSAFNGHASFESSAFNGDAYFVSSAFNGTAYFVSSTYNGTAYFVSSAFNGDAYFVSSAFNGDADFGDDTFDKEADFNDVVFKGNASFNRSQFREDALFENTTFQMRLSLTKTRYDKLFMRWNNIEGGLVYDDAAYMSLMKNFKDLGYFEDYDSCYFQYRKEHRGQPWPLVGGVDKPIRKSIDFFLEWFYGYGTRPLNAVYFSLAFIIIFGIFWRAIGLGGPNDVTGEESKVWEKPNDALDIFGFSTTVFLSGTRLFIDPPDIPMIKGRSRSMIKKAFTLERILGALFSILFFLAISGTVIR
jgi:hypothetical protein